jgi:thiol-disulfide isomerase/thioredoxin
MPSNRAVLLVALAAALAGAAASLFFEPTIAYRLAGTEVGQQVLDASIKAQAPKPPTGLDVAEKGGIVPAMTLKDVAGNPVELPRAWAGRTTLVNLWATWCAPCLKEMPDLQAFAGEQGGNGVQVVGIALDDAQAVRAFLRRHGIAYPVLVDAPGPADAGVRLGNPAGVLPYSVLVSADGRVLKTRIGPFADGGEIAGWVR